MSKDRAAAGQALDPVSDPHLLHNFKLRMGWQVSRPHNARNHTDQEVKARMTELWNAGRTYQQLANILNEEGYLPRR
jgi:hypothetical protein